MNVRRLFVGLLLAVLVMVPVQAYADEVPEEGEPLETVATQDETEPLDANSGGTVNVYRLYNWRTSEHLYTTSKKEYDTLPYKGTWFQEGVAWVAPKKSSTPVYRLYNKKLGDHHYTTSRVERDSLSGKGWKYEGVAFYSDDAKRVALYRVYNGRLRAGQHHYTTSAGERDSLVSKSGWRSEGVGFYAVKKGKTIPTMVLVDEWYYTIKLPATWQGIITSGHYGHTSGAYHVDYSYRSNELYNYACVYRVDGMVRGSGESATVSGEPADYCGTWLGQWVWESAHGGSSNLTDEQLDELCMLMTGGSLTRQRLLACPNQAACEELANREVNKFYNAVINPTIRYKGGRA